MKKHLLFLALLVSGVGLHADIAGELGKLKGKLDGLKNKLGMLKGSLGILQSKLQGKVVQEVNVTQDVSELHIDTLLNEVKDELKKTVQVQKSDAAREVYVVFKDGSKQRLSNVILNYYLGELEKNAAPSSHPGDSISGALANNLEAAKKTLEDESTSISNEERDSIMKGLASAAIQFFIENVGGDSSDQGPRSLAEFIKEMQSRNIVIPDKSYKIPGEDKALEDVLSEEERDLLDEAQDDYDVLFALMDKASALAEKEVEVSENVIDYIDKVIQDLGNFKGDSQGGDKQRTLVLAADSIVSTVHKLCNWEKIEAYYAKIDENVLKTWEEICGEDISKQVIYGRNTILKFQAMLALIVKLHEKKIDIPKELGGKKAFLFFFEKAGFTVDGLLSNYSKGLSDLKEVSYFALKYRGITLEGLISLAQMAKDAGLLYIFDDAQVFLYGFRALKEDNIGEYIDPDKSTADNSIIDKFLDFCINLKKIGYKNFGTVGYLGQAYLMREVMYNYENYNTCLARCLTAGINLKSRILEGIDMTAGQLIIYHFVMQYNFSKSMETFIEELKNFIDSLVREKLLNFELQDKYGINDLLGKHIIETLVEKYKPSSKDIIVILKRIGFVINDDKQYRSHFKLISYFSKETDSYMELFDLYEDFKKGGLEVQRFPVFKLVLIKNLFERSVNMKREHSAVIADFFKKFNERNFFFNISQQDFLGSLLVFLSKSSGFSREDKEYILNNLLLLINEDQIRRYLDILKNVYVDKSIGKAYDDLEYLQEEEVLSKFIEKINSLYAKKDSRLPKALVDKNIESDGISAEILLNAMVNLKHNEKVIIKNINLAQIVALSTPLSHLKNITELYQGVAAQTHVVIPNMSNNKELRVTFVQFLFILNSYLYLTDCYDSYEWIYRTAFLIREFKDSLYSIDKDKYPQYYSTSLDEDKGLSFMKDVLWKAALNMQTDESFVLYRKFAMDLDVKRGKMKKSLDKEGEEHVNEAWRLLREFRKAADLIPGKVKSSQPSSKINDLMKQLNLSATQLPSFVLKKQETLGLSVKPHNLLLTKEMLFPVLLPVYDESV